MNVTPEHGTRARYNNWSCRCDLCKAAGSQYQRERRKNSVNREKEIAAARRRDEKIYILIRSLKDRPCMDCGITYPIVCMQFDHRNPEDKLFNIGAQGHKYSEEAILKEAEKCDVVCANCHFIRTKARRDTLRWG